MSTASRSRFLLGIIRNPNLSWDSNPGCPRQNAIALPLVPTITAVPRRLFLLIKSFERLEKKPLKLTDEVHLLIITRAGTGLGPNPKGPGPEKSSHEIRVVPDTLHLTLHGTTRSLKISGQL